MSGEGSLKDLILRAREAAPLIEKASLADRTGIQGPIDKSKVDEVKKRLQTLEDLEKYSRAQDIFTDYLPDAAKQMVMEMKHGRSSSDRRKAAEDMMNRELGKPVNRQVNMNLTPSDFSSEELKAKNEQLMVELGYKKDLDGSKLVIGTIEAGKALPVSAPGKGDQRPEPVKEPRAKQSVPVAVPKERKTRTPALCGKPVR